MTRRQKARVQGRRFGPSARAAQQRRCPGKECLPPQPPCSRMCVDSLDTSAEDRLGYSWKFSFAYSLSWLLGKVEFVRFGCRPSCCLLAFRTGWTAARAGSAGEQIGTSWFTACALLSTETPFLRCLAEALPPAQRANRHRARAVLSCRRGGG